MIMKNLISEKKFSLLWLMIRRLGGASGFCPLNHDQARKKKKCISDSSVWSLSSSHKLRRILISLIVILFQHLLSVAASFMKVICHQSWISREWEVRSGNWLRGNDLGFEMWDVISDSGMLTCARTHTHAWSWYDNFLAFGQQRVEF